MASARHAGHAFEQAFSKLFARLVFERLGWERIDHRIQPPGAQFGKDIQSVFRLPGGRIARWHVECKGHGDAGSIKKEEILPKLVDLWRSDHDVDVFCIASANLELGNAIDELLTSMAKQLDLPFSIVRLTPEQNGLKELFACEPELFELVYPGPPPKLAAPVREARLQSFRTFLLDASLATRKPRQSTWQLVSEHSLVLAEDADRWASAYLRGFEQPGWEAVAYGWAAPRRSTTDRLLARVRDAPLGVSHAWLLGSAGEGKSTALRQAAWQAAADPELVVLWATGETERPHVPVEWIELLRPGTNVLLCVDGTLQLRGAGQLREASMRLADQGKRVVALFADRDLARSRSPAAGELARSTRPEDLIEIQQLTAPEAETLVGGLVERGLVEAERAERAVAAIQGASKRERSPGTSWLLPTMMEVTDREKRNFEQILESLLVQLKDAGRHDSVRVLLSAALAQASGGALDEAAGRRIVGGDRAALSVALEALATELAQQGLGGRPRPSGVSRLATHHRVVAEAFVHIGVTSRAQQGLFLDVCTDLAATAPTVDEYADVSSRDFRLLDLGARHLRAIGANAQAERLLLAWVELDPVRRNFLALHRLGVCYRDWLTAELAEDPRDGETIDWLLARGRATFIEHTMVTERLKADPASCPPRLSGKLDTSEVHCFQAWAVMEDRYAQEPGRAAGFEQAAFLALLSFRSYHRQRTLGEIPLILFHLGELRLAAMATSVLRAEFPADYALQNLAKLLARAGVAIPDDGVPLLDVVVARTVERLSAPDAAVWWPAELGERRRRLAGAVDHFARWLGDAPELAAVRATLVDGHAAAGAAPA